MDLSIVIVNYNVKGFLLQCLDSIYKSKTAFSFETIVVDNASVDGSEAAVRGSFPQVRWVANSTNVGFGKANNQGFKLAQGTYTLILNPDTVLREDTLERTLQYMQSHPNVGGLGIKGVDGHGEFLPESKRGLPTPLVALWKLTGLIKLFPKSPVFARYYMGHLDPNQNHEVDILVGCFMLVPTNLLLKVGGFDPRYFMYGEDIDLSYELLKQGKKNHYFADSQIIHYKGESTKRGSLNYVRMFYQAMVIFARKQFSGSSALLYTLLIYVGIYLRAFLALGARFSSKVAAPAVDALLLFFTLDALKNYWELNHRFIYGGSYPDFYTYYIQGSYVVAWIFGLWITGIYHHNSRPRALVRSFAWTTLLLGFIYGLLPEDLRFSRALLLLGALSGTTVLIAWRTIVGTLSGQPIFAKEKKQPRILFYGSEAQAHRTERILREISIFPQLFHRLSPSSALHPVLSDICLSLEITEFIVDGTTVSNEELMALMTKVPASTSVKTLLPGHDLIIGSNSSLSQGTVYGGHYYATSRPTYLRQKRIATVLCTLAIWLFLPLFMALSLATKRHRALWHWLKNTPSLLLGKQTLVGYQNEISEEFSLPKLPHPLFDILTTIPATLSDSQIKKLHAENYAKDASLVTDFSFIHKISAKHPHTR